LIVLDSDIISLLDRKSGEGFEKLVRRLNAVPDDERVCATIISFEENMRGWLGQISAARRPENHVIAYTGSSAYSRNTSGEMYCHTTVAPLLSSLHYNANTFASVLWIYASAQSF